LFPIVLRAADEADSIARDLLADAGANLAHLALIVIRRLTPHPPVAMAPTDMLRAAVPPVAMPPIATTGSVFRQSPIVRQVFYNTLQASFPGIDVRQDPVDPVEGALARARRM
jgi:N-acetylglucosamine kinase-like BadF-type ATPase